MLRFSMTPPVVVARRSWFVGVLAIMSSCQLQVSGYTPATKFLLVSNARNATISYVKIPYNGFDGSAQVESLIDHGLVHPQGLAVDQQNKILYVADPNLNKLVGYGLDYSGGGLRITGDPLTVADNVETRWVAVDGLGNVWFTDEAQNQVMMVAAQQIANGDTLPQVRFPASAPGGIALDNFYAYWANKLDGKTSGVLHRGKENIGATNVQAGESTKLASNVDKAYGVCLAIGDAFFTGDSSNVYGVQKGGTSTVSIISSNFTSPRGCVWDGDGTVYVADRGKNAVYSFAAPMVALQSTVATKSFDMEDAFGIALFSHAFKNSAGFGILMLLALIPYFGH